MRILFINMQKRSYLPLISLLFVVGVNGVAVDGYRCCCCCCCCLSLCVLQAACILLSPMCGLWTQTALVHSALMNNPIATRLQESCWDCRRRCRRPRCVRVSCRMHASLVLHLTTISGTLSLGLYIYSPRRITKRRSAVFPWRNHLLSGGEV